ncbi:MAG: hypothetical protein LQ344_000468 [Seirophora lacunosa]|nr:MAG: hypothetical protein LQ344_000468 [Seirophora lacunosa]
MSESWWKEAVVYQVYPASFKDTNKDGWGDIQGIASKLDYLKDLGVDVVWVSPMYKSPQADMGYDISDYKTIDPIYGTNDDLAYLQSELTRRDMKLMMDLVVNHTSDQHPWFLESRSSRSSPKRSWYIWKDPHRDEDGKPLPPNNWSQMLGEANSAWTYDESTDQYYLSIFTPEQPDLNWENPDVRTAVHDVMKYWLDKGACGYRMDVINLISKDQRFPDAEPSLGPDKKYHPGGKYFVNGPRMHEYLQEIKHEVLEKYGAITVGEMPGVLDIEEIVRTVKSGTGELNMIFIFDIVDIDNVPGKVRMALQDWTVKDLRRILDRWQRIMIGRDGWNSVFCENHDNPRSVSRYTDDSDKYRTYGATLLALMQTTLNGTLYVYQGQELGMRNFPKSWDPLKDYKDIEAINFWKKSLDLFGSNAEELVKQRKVLEKKARDHARTPMQWNAGMNAGFTDDGVTPWMRVNDDYREVNAEKQLSNESEHLSVWQFWQRGLANRKTRKDVFTYGDFETVGLESEEVLAYVRTGKESGRWLIVLNFSGKEVDWPLPDDVEVEGWMAGNYTKGRPEKSLKTLIALHPWEGLLGKCR